MENANLILFLTASVIVILAPGPDNMLVLTRGVTLGGGVAPQLLVLGLAFAAMTWAIFSVVALLSGALGGWLRSKPRFANGLSWLTGGVLIALGLRLALPERR